MTIEVIAIALAIFSLLSGLGTTILVILSVRRTRGALRDVYRYAEGAKKSEARAEKLLELIKALRNEDPTAPISRITPDERDNPRYPH